MPILDPRDGDIEDDASSTHQRSLLSLAGSLLGEISLPKLVMIWVMLLLLPALALGLAPLLVSAWVIAVWSKTAGLLTELVPTLLLPVLVAAGWFGGRRVLRLAESSFWSLNALAVQPVYVICRESLRHLAEAWLPADVSADRRATIRAICAALSGVVLFLLGLGVIALLWPATHWVGLIAELTHVRTLVPILLANSATIITAYCAGANLAWGVHDALMPQPRDLEQLDPPVAGARTWRVVHLSDLHTVGERYGFRIESGRAGPRGNDRLWQTFARLDEIHRRDPLDVVMITGDLTDAGRSAEWVEFMRVVDAYPDLASRIVALPGNHDVNVVDRTSPARMDTPLSPTKRLRQMRTLSALEQMQGSRLHVIENGALGRTVSDMVRPAAGDMAAFADTGAPRRLSRSLEQLWDNTFPMILPPETPHGLGILALNSNADTHFSFTNALGLLPVEQMRRVKDALRLYPRACWIIALHHHVIEYPRKTRLLSMRIGTALINGSWAMRQLQAFAGRGIVMHGHRHVDWFGRCGALKIISAPSQVMAREAPYCHVHTLAIGPDQRLHLCATDRIDIPA